MEKHEVDTPENRHRLLAELTSHIGEPNAAGMAALYEAVFERPWDHRINDTRAVRTLITAMRREGIPICSSAKKEGGGYYLAAAGSELADYLRRNERRALLILSRNAKIKKIALPNYLGQIRMNMEGDNGEAA
ncbi:MAG: hypothetical protein RBT20_01795 [Syntrophales bacterium]|jgi:hypothetical protein|nr:hypothetical protein [Syntrophales bacterium]